MNRKCGDCQLCCVLLPVADGAVVDLPDGTRRQLDGLNKLANTRCPHQKTGVGCKLHGTPKMPYSCSIWVCKWLTGEDTADLPRPDRSHYVIDPMPDVVGIQNNETGAVGQFEVIQVWVDPRYRTTVLDDPGLRRYIDRNRKCALLRLNSRDSIFLAPPSVTLKDWVIQSSSAPEDAKPSTINEISKVLGAEIEYSDISENGMIRTKMVRPDGTEIEIATKPKDW